MIISLFLVILLALIGYSIYNTEYINAIKQYNIVRKEIPIFTGYLDLKDNKDKEFDTFNQFSTNYLNLSPSVNQNGGAEYTYNFWLWKNGDEICSSNYKVLFFRGSKNKIPYTTENCLSSTNSTPYILVKNPLVRISKDGKKIIIEYNTITKPDAFGNSTAECNRDTGNKRMLGIYDLSDNYDKQFIMITVVLKEISSEDDIFNKNVTNCKLYLNSVLVLDKNTYDTNTSDGTTIPTVMKHNYGKFYFNPTNIIGNDSVDDDKNLLMADLTYYNYAIEPSKIEELFNKGFTNKEGSFIKTSDTENSYLKGNKFDIESPDSVKPY